MAGRQADIRTIIGKAILFGNGSCLRIGQIGGKFLRLIQIAEHRRTVLAQSNHTKAVIV